jgi:hypothetical protein
MARPVIAGAGPQPAGRRRLILPVIALTRLAPLHRYTTTFWCAAIVAAGAASYMTLFRADPIAWTLAKPLAAGGREPTANNTARA